MSPEYSVGSVVAGHRVDGVINEGGMGVVYRAVDLELEREVALKVIRPEYARDAEFKERFKREARVIARLDHPNIIRIWRCVDEEPLLFVTMQLIHGSDLAELLKDGRALPPGHAAHVVAHVATALDKAHASGVVHRDVKPQNILLDQDEETDRVVLTDFGLAKDNAAVKMTRTGMVMGTPAYMAPEQTDSRPVDARTDVYALGCVLFETLTGRIPFAHNSWEAMLYAHCHEPPPRVSEWSSNAPTPFDDIVSCALAKEPDERFSSAGDLGRAAIAAAADGPLIEPRGSVARGNAAWGADRRRRRASSHDGDSSAAPSDDESPAPGRLQLAAVSRQRRRAAQDRVAKRERIRAERREAERQELAQAVESGQAGLIAAAQAIGVPKWRYGRLLDKLRPREQVKAAMMCARANTFVENVFLVVTDSRILWVRETVMGQPEYGSIEGSEIKGVEQSGNDLNFYLHSGGEQKVNTWKRDRIAPVEAATRELIEA